MIKSFFWGAVAGLVVGTVFTENKNNVKKAFNIGTQSVKSAMHDMSGSNGNL